MKLRNLDNVVSVPMGTYEGSDVLSAFIDKVVYLTKDAISAINEMFVEAKLPEVLTSKNKKVALSVKSVKLYSSDNYSVNTEIDRSVVGLKVYTEKDFSDHVRDEDLKVYTRKTVEEYVESLYASELTVAEVSCIQQEIALMERYLVVINRVGVQAVDVFYTMKNKILSEYTRKRRQAAFARFQYCMRCKHYSLEVSLKDVEKRFDADVAAHVRTRYEAATALISENYGAIMWQNHRNPATTDQLNDKVFSKDTSIMEIRSQFAGKTLLENDTQYAVVNNERSGVLMKNGWKFVEAISS